jgi:hypothetical protein
MLEYFYTGNISIDATAGSSENPIDLESAPQSSTAGAGSHMIYPAHTSPFSYSPLVNSTQGLNLSSFNFGYASLPPLPPPLNIPSLPTFSFPGNETLPDVSQSPITPPVNSQNLVTLAAIYVCAEKWDIQPLKTLAKEKYGSILSSAWNTEHFVHSLKLIYDGTPDTSEPDGLRELAIKAAATHAKELLDRGEFLNLCKERGDLATDVLKASLHQTSEDGGSGIPRCRVNSNHAIHVVQGTRTFNSQASQRYKCAVCSIFID